MTQPTPQRKKSPYHKPTNKALGKAKKEVQKTFYIRADLPPEKIKALWQHFQSKIYEAEDNFIFKWIRDHPDHSMEEHCSNLKIRRNNVRSLCERTGLPIPKSRKDFNIQFDGESNYI